MRVTTIDLVSAGVACVAAWLVLGVAVCPLIVAMLVALAVHRRALLRAPSSARFLRLYLLALGWQVLHFAEELTTDLAERWPEMLGSEAWSTTRFVAFNAIAYAIFLAAGLAAHRGRHAGTVFATFFIVASLGTAIGHVALAAYVGGYFPGALTAPISIVLGLLCARTSNGH